MAKKLIELKNGVRIVIESLDEYRSCTVGYWMDGGAREETEKQRGISHFIEHTIFKGTKTRTAKEIAAEIESKGGTIDAFTTKENTCFYAKVMGDHTPTAFDILSDLILNPLFHPDDVEKEKMVILEEIKKSLDEPEDIVIQNLFRVSLGLNHPLAFPIIGNMNTVKHIHSEEIKSYFNEHYTANRLLISIAGDIKLEEVEKLKERMEIMEGGKSPLVEDNENNPLPSLITKRKRELAQVHIGIGKKGIPYNHPDRYVFALLSTVLTGGMSSRLFQKLREEKGLVYVITGFLESYKDTGVYGFYLASDRRKYEDAILSVFDELENISNQGVRENELKDAKEQLIGELILALENTPNRMIKNARETLYLNRMVSVDEIIHKIREISIDRVNEIARTMFKPDDFSISLAGNVKKVGNDVLRQRKIIQ